MISSFIFMTAASSPMKVEFAIIEWPMLRSSIYSIFSISSIVDILAIFSSIEYSWLRNDDCVN